MYEEQINQMQLGGKSFQEWKEEMKAPSIPTTMNYTDAESLGFISDSDVEVEQPQQENKFYNALDTIGVEHPDIDKQYQQLSLGESWKDAGLSLLAEASHIFVPKSMEWNYEAKTHFGENVKYGYRYLAGTAGFLLGGEVLAGVKGLGLLGKALQGVGKAVTGKNMFNVTRAGLKAGRTGKSIKGAMLGTKLAKASFEGAVAGALADFTLYRPEENEGHLADVFGQTDNAFINYLQSKDTDTDIDAKLKNVVEGFVVGLGVGNLVEFGAKPLFKRAIKNFKAAKEGKAGAAEALIQDEINIEKFANKADLIEKVETIKAEAEANGQEASQLLIDRLHPEDNVEAQKMLKALEDGEEIFLHSDGTWDITVREWDEAYKVSPEEFKKQLTARDEAAGGYAGDTAISYQDKAVKDTWTNRGWIGENESLITETKTGKKANTSIAKNIVKNYTDKWEIDNNVKVEFVDGLKVKGQAVEGNTSATKYKGKTQKPTKAAQTKIDKKKQEIRRLQDRITQVEGGNGEVHDELDLLKEDLRIKYEELKALENIPQAKKIPDITIQIDVNAKNPYATLRAELEHARDIAKGEVPNQSEKHFSRYDGLNEGEVAPDYVYKKAQGKANALNPEASQNVMNDRQIIDDGVKYNKETIDGQRTNEPNRNTTDKDIIVRRFVEGISEYNSSRSDGNGVFVRRDAVWVVDTNAEKLFDDANISKTGYQELPQTVEAGQAFVDALERAKINLEERGEYVDVHTAEDYANARTFLSEDGLAGFAITKDGEIVSVFADPAAKLSDFRGRGRAMIELAKQLGGTHLNCYDVGLPNYYQAHGFKETNRYKGDDKFWQPDKWHKEKHKKFNNGEPDVVDMALETKAVEPPTPVQPQQLKLDFSQTLETKQTTGDIANGLVSGEVKPTTKADIEAIVTKVEQTEPEIAGFNWKAVVENPEAYIKDLERIFSEEDTSGLVEALAKGDFETLENIIKKELAAVKIMGELYNTVKTKGLDVADEVKMAVINSVYHLGEYIKGVKSGFGSGLQAQKGINEVLESYGATRLSSWTKEGIDVFAKTMVDAINDIISLNFTRGQKLTPQQVKEQLVDILLNNQETSEYTAFLLKNKDMSATFAKEIESLMKHNGGLTPAQGKDTLMKILTIPEYDAMYKAASKAPDEKGFWNTIKNWCDGNGGLTSYYVHNLLSGVGSLAKNIGSGLINTAYFPARKILASYDLFTDTATREALGKEGWRTYKCMLQSWDESFQLMKEAFISGNGKLTDIGENTLNMDNGKFKGFHELKSIDYYFQDPAKFWEGMQNFHSIMTRAMGATDEFMSQLNYRSIVRSKALLEAENLAIEAGKVGDEAWINQQAENIFKTKFDNHGKPTDVQALNEARTILYQNNLNGTMYDYSTGKEVQMRDPSFVMNLASGLQTQANKNAFIKCMFPFVKTGTNILQMSLDHNIFYMVASPTQQKLLIANTAEGALARAQCAFGAFSLMFGSMMAFNGLITGSAPSDPRERKALFATGWRPYSFKLGDTYISYQGYEPIHSMLGFAADCANMYSTITNPEDEKRFEHFRAQILPTLVNNFLDKAAFRTGLSQLDLIMNSQDASEWQRAMAQTAKGFLPDVAMVTNAKSVGEHEVLQPKTFYERVFYRYFPEAWTPMDYRRNVFGEKQSITGLLVTTVGSQDGSPEEQALEYLARYGYTPTEIDDVIANTGLKISQFKDPDTGRSAMDAMKEEMSMVTIQGMTLREALRALVTSEDYQYLPDGVDLDTGARWGAKEDTKINAINDIFLMYKQRAKKNIMDNCDYFVDSEGRTILDATEEIQLKRLEHLNSLY